MTIDPPPSAVADDTIDVFFASTSYPRDATDWRGVFMAHICHAFSRRDDIRLLRWAPPGQPEPRIADATTADEARWLSRLMQRGGISHWLRSRPVSGMFAAERLLRLLRAGFRRHPNVDLYHVNWLQTALALPDNGKPVLITALGNDMKLLRLPFVRPMLRRKFRNRPVAICPNADWMAAPLHEAFGDVARIVPVPFGIDPQWYAIRRMPARPARWLVVSRLTADKLGPLFEWSEPLFANERRELHLFGPMQEQVALPDWVHYHGPATPRQLAQAWFPQAHGLITLSRHAEGRPQVMLEAMAASLPIVASATPAHADIVRNEVTGLLCDSPEAYSSALHLLENADLNRRYGLAARSRMEAEMGTWDDCISRYVNIYRILQGHAENA